MFGKVVFVSHDDGQVPLSGVGDVRPGQRLKVIVEDADDHHLWAHRVGAP